MCAPGQTAQMGSFALRHFVGCFLNCETFYLYFFCLPYFTVLPFNGENSTFFSAAVAVGFKCHASPVRVPPCVWKPWVMAAH